MIEYSRIWALNRDLTGDDRWDDTVKYLHSIYNTETIEMLYNSTGSESFEMWALSCLGAHLLSIYDLEISKYGDAD